MDDAELIARLRKREHYYLNAIEGEHDGDLFRKAICRILDQATRLETLTAENERLREALKEICDPFENCALIALGNGQYADPKCVEIARAALQPQEKVG